MENILFPFENREKLIERLFVENTKLLEMLQELAEKYNGLLVKLQTIKAVVLNCCSVVATEKIILQ